MSENMVERVAKAIFATDFPDLDWDKVHRGMHPQYIQGARAAIAAMREPTEAMLSAMQGPFDMGTDVNRLTPRLNEKAYQAAIDAALSK